MAWFSSYEHNDQNNCCSDVNVFLLCSMIYNNRTFLLNFLHPTLDFPVGIFSSPNDCPLPITFFSGA